MNKNSPEPASFDAAIDAAMRPVADAASNFIFFSIDIFGTQVPLIVLWLVAGGVFFTIYFGFINFRGFKHAIDIVRGKLADPADPGEISQFQALTTAVSGTVGIGNIAGVAVAISVGGPGATFWLIVAGLLGMSTKFAECTLGVMFRKQENGEVSGGSNVLSGARSCGQKLANTGARFGYLLCFKYGDRLPRYRQHVPIEPGGCHHC